MSSFRGKIQSLMKKVETNNAWRQRECFNLIPSEMTPSLLVKICEISDPAGRYAEHRTMKGREVYFYQGTDFIREIEEEAQREICQYFGCAQAELRPISGQMANEIVFKGITKFVNRGKKGPFRRLKSVVNNDLNKGGHLSSQPMGALFNFVEMEGDSHEDQVFNIPVQEDNPYRPNIEKLKELIGERQPELVIFGKSMFICKEPVKEIAEFTSTMENPPLIMFDMAHVLGLYGAFQSPFQEGAHLVTGSTHKTFYGPQRGVIAGNLNEKPFKKLWSQIQSRAFPGSTSNHHLGTLLGLLLATYEMNAFKDQYQTQVVKNAKAFARALSNSGIKVEGDPAMDYTETHQVILRVIDQGPGEEIARKLENNNIITNYQALPDDTSFLQSSGIRIGAQEMTRFGMVEKDFEKLAGLVTEVIKEDKNIKEEVKTFRRDFLEMKFCLPPEEGLPLAARALHAVFPKEEYGKIFAENLMKNS